MDYARRKCKDYHFQKLQKIKKDEQQKKKNQKEKKYYIPEIFVDPCLFEENGALNGILIRNEKKKFRYLPKEKVQSSSYEGEIYSNNYKF